jgi:catechol 2,3-dioxygenase-like lactoylglutathione lyase family enzyme
MPEPPFTAIAHVQLAMPKGAEDAARLFYRDLLGMIEIPKPPELAKRGGVWFQSGPVQLHLGVEDDFKPARKAHPALRCGTYQALTDRLRDRGVPVHDDTSLPGVTRCHIHDCFGNRIELIAT